MKSSVIKALQHLSKKPEDLFVKVLEHGSMSVELYKPVEVDLQTPHLQDELYVIISGYGEFLNDGVRTPFQQGNVLFVKAGVEHRFENFTPDFATWVIFYGPDGGE
ncbi:cupin domain-containing protein [Mucilaginibacter aquaedulcis]|uniref:cupin domain-containing protein n=1 Tax=Mucilaginibacter aquaedulcis TaxID=1187081 RepID=UPI0025B3835D|nr:cupin domain-containing protein [Mucilaginibacter aquaedulcis]MDN3546816.1 cupin domain-containing protein [Mucilaginibacter aquaedulcis]